MSEHMFLVKYSSNDEYPSVELFINNPSGMITTPIRPFRIAGALNERATIDGIIAGYNTMITKYKAGEIKKESPALLGHEIMTNVLESNMCCDDTSKYSLNYTCGSRIFAFKVMVSEDGTLSLLDIVDKNSKEFIKARTRIVKQRWNGVYDTIHFKSAI